MKLSSQLCGNCLIFRGQRLFSQTGDPLHLCIMSHSKQTLCARSLALLQKSVCPQETHLYPTISHLSILFSPAFIVIQLYFFLTYSWYPFGYLWVYEMHRIFLKCNFKKKLLFMISYKCRSQNHSTCLGLLLYFPFDLIGFKFFSCTLVSSPQSSRYVCPIPQFRSLTLTKYHLLLDLVYFVIGEHSMMDDLGIEFPFASKTQLSNIVIYVAHSAHQLQTPSLALFARLSPFFLCDFE